MSGFDFKELGGRLATRRKALRLKQADVAERSGLHQSNISNYEQGKSPRLSVANLARVASALKTKLSTLLRGL